MKDLQHATTGWCSCVHSDHSSKGSPEQIAPQKQGIGTSQLQIWQEMECRGAHDPAFTC